MQQCLWPMLKMLTIPPGCWRKPRYETFWVQKICTRSSVTVRASRAQCRKDARLPVQLQRAMAAEAEAAREARAKVIAAEGEQKASRALREASEVIAESSSALQLRYLQTLNSISAEKNSTIIFPLPIDLLTHFMHGGPTDNGTKKAKQGKKAD